MWCTLDRKPQQVPQSQPLPSEMLPHAQRVRERAALLRMEQENKRRRERITADHEQSSDRIAPSAALPSSTAPMSADQKERNRQGYRRQSLSYSGYFCAAWSGPYLGNVP